MDWQYIPYVHLLLAAAACSVVLALYVARHRSARGAAALAVLMLAVAEYTLGYALELGSPDLANKIFWAKVEYLGITIMPLAWLAFALQYTNRDQWLTPRNLRLLALVPAITLFLVWTNQAHHLIWRYTGLDDTGPFVRLEVTYGAWFWVHSAFSYALMLLGTLQIILMLRRSPHLYRQQTGAVLLGVLLPWAGNALYISGVAPIHNLDLTPFAFTLSGFPLAWSLFRFRLLDIVPVARRAVVDGMRDGVIVLDTQHRIVDLNPAAQHIVGPMAAEAIGRPIAALLSSCPDLLDRYGNVTEAQEEIVLGQGERQRCFDLRISPLYGQHGRLEGRLIVLHDISERKRVEEALRRAEAETRARLKEQVALREAAAVISSTLDLDVVLRHIAEQMGRAVDATGVYICGYEPETQTSRVLAEYVHPQASNHERVSDLNVIYYLPEDLPGVVESLMTGQPVVDRLNDQDSPRPEPVRLRQLGARTILTIPLQIGGETIAYAQLWESRRQREFTSEEIGLCQGIAQQAAVAIRNAELHDEIRRQAADLSTLYTVTRMASRSLDLEDVLAHALSSALLSLGFEAGLISLVDPSDGRLRLAVEYGLPANYTRWLQREGMERTLYAYVHALREGLVVNDLRQQSPVDCSDLVAMGFQACAGIPLLHRQQSLGTLSLLSRKASASASHNMALLAAIGDRLAAAVVNARLFRNIADERSRLQALIESSQDGIVLVGIDRRVLVTNAPALELLRLPGQAEDWINRPLGDALAALRRHAPHVARVTIAEMRRIERGDEPPGEGEYEVLPRSIHWLNLPVEANGTPLGRLLVLRDVTEERLLERMREDLTRAMVHDLRNPLTAIFGALEFLKLGAGNLSGDQAKMLEIAASSTRGMLELVNKILDLSRLEGGHMPLQYAQVSLANVIAEVLGTQSSLAMDKGVRLESKVPPDLTLIWADAKLITRVLQNLVDNAVKFTPPGGLVKVTVSPLDSKTVGQADGHAAAGTHLLVSVSDSGPGIPPELRSRLFQRFASGRQAGSGSGLGLAFCKLALEAHGCQIWAEPETGRGTTFRFTLPLPGKGNGLAEMKVSGHHPGPADDHPPITAG